MVNTPYMFWSSLNSIVTYEDEVVICDGDIVTVDSVFDRVGA